MTPAETQKTLLAYHKNLEQVKKKSVFVGLPKGKTGSKIYKDGTSVLEVGASHEYGVPSRNLPRRSFLRVPFAVKRKELEIEIARQFKKVFEGRDSIKALNIIGVTAQNISQGAFRSRGYGTWKDITDATKDNKGSSQVLIDQGTLRNSITWVVL